MVFVSSWDVSALGDFLALHLISAKGDHVQLGIGVSSHSSFPKNSRLFWQQGEMILKVF